MIPVVISQYVEESALLWIRRDQAVGEPHFYLRDLIEMDNRISAQLDGLRLAGSDGWEACLAELSWSEIGEVFTAAAVAVDSGRTDRIQTVWQTAEASCELQSAFARTLGWLRGGTAGSAVERFWSGSMEQQRVALQAATMHGDLGQGMLDTAFASGDACFERLAFEAIGRLAQEKYYDHLIAGLSHDVAGCRRAAAWALLLRANDCPEALDAVKSSVEGTPSAGDRGPIGLLLERLTEQETERWVQQLVQTRGDSRLAVIAAGIAGRAEQIPWLLERMQDAVLARLAAEAFATITGLEINDAEFEGQSIDAFDAGPSEDPADDQVTLDPDEHLPWPNQTAIRAWWRDHAGDFRPRTRFLLGQPCQDDHLEKVLRDGNQRMRALAATWLAVRHPDRPLFDVTAPGRRQENLLKRDTIRACESS